MTSAASEDLEVGPTGSAKSWDLMVYTAGGCNYTSRQLLGLLRHSHRPPIMKCTLNWASFGGRPTLANPVSSVAPTVNGHPAFWAAPVCNTNQCNLPRAMLVWNYAQGGWARLSGPSRSDALKIAGRVTSVYIYTGTGVTPDAIAIFAHHLRLLGANPAAWTTRPLG